MNLEHEQKNFSDFNDYFNSLFEHKSGAFSNALALSQA